MFKRSMPLLMMSLTAIITGCASAQPEVAVHRAPALPPTPDFQPRRTVDVASAAQASVALIVCHNNGNNSEIGTGFLMAPGYILTAAHLMENGGQEFVACFPDKQARVCKPYVIDTPADLLVLEVLNKDGLPPVLPIRPTAPRLGEEVLVPGFPAPPSFTATNIELRDIEPVLTHGIVSCPQIEAGVPATKMLLIDAGVAGGNSGGPVIGMDGQVIGLVVGGSKVFQFQSLAVPNSRIIYDFARGSSQ